MSSPKMLDAGEVRKRILDLLQSGPKRTIEFTHAIYPGAPTQTPDKAPSNWSSQVSTQVRMLEKQGVVDKGEPKNRFSPWRLRTKPDVSDLPANPQPKRIYKRKDTDEMPSMNGHAASLRSYIIRDIKAKLDELERMG